MARLSLYLLGPWQLTRAAEGALTINYDKVRALLAYLAVEGEQAHRRDALMTMLWPELPEGAARNNLRQVLMRLSQAIGNNEIAPPFLLIDRTSLQFNGASDAWLDVTEFTALLAACDSHAHRDAERCRPCAQRRRQAVDLYRGPFLADFFLPDSAAFEEWALSRREWLNGMALSALAHLGAFYERRGQYEQARTMARRQLELEPWREAAHRQLMRLHLLEDQRTAALAQYQQCRRILAAELGVEPDAETTALYEQIRGDTNARRTEVIPPAVPISRSHRLPIQATQFVGRADELGEIVRLLRDGHATLLTLTGPGGIGKSRLALQAAEEQLEGFADGVFFVSLASLSSGNQMIAAIRTVLGLEPVSSDPEEHLLAWLESKELLLVLDSFEHLLAGASLLSHMLARSPDLVLLVTSRERLGLQGEWVIAVEGLSTQPRQGDEGEPADALQLFVQAARRVRPRFALSAENQPEVERICQLAGGMPLAIELAAAWVRVLSCREIAEEILASIEFLTTTLRDVPERHRSLISVLEQSWQRLAPEEQAVLRRLSVFRGGFQREAAAAVVAGATLATLAALVDKSLLRRAHSARFEMHEITRQFALQQLEAAGEAVAVRTQHLMTFVEMVEGAEPRLQEMSSNDATRQLDLEYDNIQAALDFALESRRVEQGLRLGGALWLYWWIRSRSAEGRRWLSEFLAHAEKVPHGVRATALRAAGGLAYYQDDLVEAEAHFAAALDHFRAAGDKLGLTRVLRNLGTVASDQGQYARAKRYLTQSLELAREIGDAQSVANTLSEIASMDYYQGKLQSALASCDESLALNRERGDQHDIAISLHNLAELCRMTGELTRSIALYEEAARLFEAIGSTYGCAFTLYGRGELASAQGQHSEARALFQEGLKLFREMDHVYGTGLSLCGLAAVALAEGEPERAARMLSVVAELIRADALVLRPPEQKRFEQVVDAVRARLGEEGFARAAAEGRRLPVAQAVAQALGKGVVPAPQ